jgi:hypothetical protein
MPSFIPESSFLSTATILSKAFLPKPTAAPRGVNENALEAPSLSLSSQEDFFSSSVFSSSEVLASSSSSSS